MRLEDILRELEASIADHRLSEEEKQLLVRLLREVSPPEEGLRRLRNAAFELVRQRLDGPDPFSLLKWLEGVVRCIDNFRTSPASVQSVAYFSPGVACRNAIVHRLNQTRNMVDICVFTISDDQIAEAILRAHSRGVVVRIITDDAKVQDIGSDISRLGCAGVPVVTDSPRAHMHHKFAIMDGVWLLTGSFNWTWSASTVNEENLVETNDPSLLRQFSGQFQSLWTKFGPPQVS